MTASSNELLASLSNQETIRLVDRLRTLGLDQYIELPQIAVVGDTSCGKSSLLSAISGLSFPSASTITTRCPTQLVLSQSQVFRGNVRLVRQSGLEEDAQALDAIEDVPYAIERLTKKLQDEGQDISEDQIVIDIGSSDLPDLTLIDLPGLIRAVGDNEREGLIDCVKRLVQKFMTQERTVIIAVAPANVDMHNTEVLQEARRADPDGGRTIGVITKLDLVDHGAEGQVRDLLENKTKALPLGYHAVKCRGQQELNENVSVRQGIANEEAFFSSHVEWKHISKDLVGTRELQRKLVNILDDNIRASLPSVLSEIKTNLSKAEAELMGMGTKMESIQSRRYYLSSKLRAYSQIIMSATSGRYDSFPPDFVGCNSTNVRTRAVLSALDNEFKASMDATCHPLPFLKTFKKNVAKGDHVDLYISEEVGWKEDVVISCNHTDIRCKIHSEDWYGESRWRFNRCGLKNFIQENRGDELRIFTSERVFRSLVSMLVDRWEAPAMKLLENYRRQLELLSNAAIEYLGVSQGMAHIFHKASHEVLQEVSKTAKEDMKTLLQSEHRPYSLNERLEEELEKLEEAYYTDRLRMVSQRALGSTVDVQSAVSAIKLSQVDRQTLKMEWALEAYAKIALVRVLDRIPMHLNDRMVVPLADRTDRKVAEMSDESLEKALRERPTEAKRRKDLEAKVSTLKSAKEDIEGMWELVM